MNERDSGYDGGPFPAAEHAPSHELDREARRLERSRRGQIAEVVQLAADWPAEGPGEWLDPEEAA
jgi:hypothetical protein